jgi:uncharacterized protein
LDNGMLADLDRLVKLQQLDDFVDNARRRIAECPQTAKALEDQLTGSIEQLAAARERFAQNLSSRQGGEKDLAAAQSRLSKFKDQLMDVKTNREYQAMQLEIEMAREEVRRIEDGILERMLQADDLAALITRAEAELREVQARVESERLALDEEAAGLQAELERSSVAREALVAAISPQALETFRYVAQGRRGIGMAEARDGYCTICHVRLRPQVFNDVRRNDTIIQCESCSRILYFVAASAPSERAREVQ